MIKADQLHPDFSFNGNFLYNLSAPELVEQTIKNQEGLLGTRGELLCRSGKYTGRSPKDKFFVDEPNSHKQIWWGEVNKKLAATSFEKIKTKLFSHLAKKKLYVFDGYAGADVNYRIKVRFIVEKAWHAMFVHNMFIKVPDDERDNFEPDFTVINGCSYSEADWQALGLNSEIFIAINLSANLCLVGGTEYAGEMKKAIFSVLNYKLPLQGVLPMHCSATVGYDDDVAIYFGLSGTGKTTLSADENRKLIGDDEHGWSNNGVFNFEGGCYAKTIRLSPHIEPDIWNAVRFGSLLENVTYAPHSRIVDFNDSSITENSRVSYPIEHIAHIQKSGKAGHPSYIFMLTCDAFGVLPPIAKLEPEQASYHFLSGYTAKVAGTERGITEPVATFSACFGRPFMSQSPRVYSDLLKDKMHRHHTKAYLINTGWVGESHTKRIPLKITRQIISDVLAGIADKSEFMIDPVFGLAIPKSLPTIGEAVLNPSKAWGQEADYNRQRKKLAKMFIANFKQEHYSYAAELAEFGPKL